MAGTAPPRLQIGATTCHILSDGKHRSDGGAFFGVVPRILWERVVQPDARNMIPVDVRCLLIETGDQKILVDTGHGDKFDAKLRKRYGLPPERDRLIADLARAGFAPEDVTMVLMTHLHADHAGGMTRWRDQVEGGPVESTFPNAAYIVQGREYDAATHPNERTIATYYPDNWQVLTGTGQLRMVMGATTLAPMCAPRPRPDTRSRCRSCGSSPRAKVCSSWGMPPTLQYTWNGFPGCPPSTRCRSSAWKPKSGCARKSWRKTHCWFSSTIPGS